jgi:hypothetical protein
LQVGSHSLLLPQRRELDVTPPYPAPLAVPPTAVNISVAQTLALLDGRFAELGQGVAEGRYALWLGSGISRFVVDDLTKVVTKVLRYLRAHADFAVADCAIAEALGKALDLAELGDAEKAKFDRKAEFALWDAEVLQAIVGRLVGKYSKLLNIRVRGQEPDFLLWDVVDAAHVYADPALAPECEHLCVALLAIEGVLQDLPTANWDGLIEKAVDELAGANAPILQVCVVAGDFPGPARRTRLLKFHGCAVRARQDPAGYRDKLIARQPQIEEWSKAKDSAAMHQQIVSLATVRHTLMVGLSAQDTNIRDVFRSGRDAMKWTWPSHPPAYVFAEDVVGDDQKVILNAVYREAYDADPDAVAQSAHIRAFAKPLLVALVLEVLRRKLVALARCAQAPNLTPADHDDIEAGLTVVRDRLAASADGDRTVFMRALVAESARAVRMMRAAHTSNGTYEPLGIQTANQIPADPGNATSGLPELATVLGLLGLGERDGHWALERADPVAPLNGSARVTPTGSAPQRVFFVANQEAALQLHMAGIVGADDPDAVVVYSTAPEPRPTRSPHARRRTGIPATRRVGLRPLLRDAPNLAELRRRFRTEAVL